MPTVNIDAYGKGYYTPGRNASYPAVHNQATSDFYQVPTDVSVGHDYAKSLLVFIMYRGLLQFDLTGLTPPIFVVNATLFCPRIYRWATHTTIYACLVDGTGITGQPEGYYIMRSRITPFTAYEIPAGTGWSSVDNVSIPINNDGKLLIESKAGDQCYFGVRIDQEIDYIQPGYGGTVDERQDFRCYWTGTYRCYLIIDYIQPGPKDQPAIRTLSQTRLLSPVRNLSAVRNIDP